jgi:hypothetical protein
MDPTGGATAVAVASLNKWSLDMSRDTVEVTCFGDPNKQYVMGLADVKGTVGGFWDSATSGDLFDVAAGEVPPMLKLLPSSLEPTFLWTGLAYLSMGIEVDAGGAVSINGDFVGAGPWTREPAGP